MLGGKVFGKKVGKLLVSWMTSLLCHHHGRLDLNGLLGDPLVQLPQLERHKGLQESGAVVRAGGICLLKNVLRQLAVELGTDVRQVGLHVD